MKLTFLGLLCSVGVLGFAQTITYGPIVGGVTDTSCNIFLGTSAPTAFTILLSNTYPFGSIVASGVGTTDSTDSVGIAHITGLTPNTQYYMRVTINGMPISTPAKFSTLLAPDSVGHQVFLTGACISGLTDTGSAIFNQASSENAKAFIQLGNWGYPDAVEACQDIYLSNPPTSWAASYGNVQSLYKGRYSSTNMGSFIQSLALDYVYDDHDYMNEKTGKAIVLAYEINPFSGILGAPLSHSQPLSVKPNSLKGYMTYFPGYTLPDTSVGIYHSFRSGNAEFFVLDTRSARGPMLMTVDTINGSTSQWAYLHDSASHILGNEQMAWLQNALGQSTATWKFIVSSVPFNLGERFVMDSLISRGDGSVPYWNPNLPCYPLLSSHGYSATNHFADMWAGFKADGDSLLKYVVSNNIPNVFVVSGSTGTVGLDDGVNSGLPELMSANMKITNSEDALDCQNFMGFNIWDMGGSGLCRQQNLNSTYGKIEIYNNDSIRLSAVDENGVEVTGGNFYAGAAYKYNPAYSPFRIPRAVADVVNINENDTAIVINILANDSDLNGYPLYVNLQTNPAHGTATLNSNNTVTYVPDTGFAGIDTFYYRACDHTNPVCGNCADAMVTIHISKVSAINELQSAVSFNIYPNPADDVLFVTAANSKGNLKFELLNILGQQLQQVNFAEHTTIDISEYAVGYYIYNILDRNNQLLKVGKIMVVR